MTDGSSGRGTEHGPNGTAILVDMPDSDRDVWHHSTAFDGYNTHATACGMHVYTGRVEEVGLDPVGTWDQEVSVSDRCPECHGSIRSLHTETDHGGQADE